MSTYFLNIHLKKKKSRYANYEIYLQNVMILILKAKLIKINFSIRMSYKHSSNNIIALFIIKL